MGVQNRFWEFGGLGSGFGSLGFLFVFGSDVQALCRFDVLKDVFLCFVHCGIVTNVY